MAVKLLDGEGLIWSGRPSWRSMLAFYLKWGGLALVPLVAVALAVGVGNADWSVWIGVAVSAVLLVIVLLVGWITRIETLYTVTDQRILIRKGILSRREKSAHIDRVQNVTTTQSVLDRILQVGDVDFDTAGTDDYEFKFAGVDSPRNLRELIAKAYGERVQELEG